MTRLPGPTIGLRGLRWILGAVAVLLALTLVTPLWVTFLEAPQYHDEEELQVRVWAGWVTGDVDEISVLNQYVGVRLPLDTPELSILPWVLGSLVVAALVSLSLPATRRYRAAIALLVLMLTSAVVGAAVLQVRLIEMGHERGQQVLEGVPDFTPPIFGAIHVANFDAVMLPGVGGWAFFLATALLAWALLATDRRGSISAPPTVQAGSQSVPRVQPADSAERSPVELFEEIDQRLASRAGS